MNQLSVTFNPDSLQEVRVLQNNYSPKYSLLGASVVLLQTKSGTASFHGSVFEYFRNDDLNARYFTALFRGPIYSNEDLYSAGRGFWGALATWEDTKAVRWIYAPAWGPVQAKAPAFPMKNGETPEGALMAFRVEEKEGKPLLTPAWISRNMNVPEPPIVANGVVFLVSIGENALQADSEGHLLTSEQRIKTAPGHAVLYALNAETGKELYDIGSVMPAIAHFSGIAISNGRIFVTTLDSNLYSFGLDESDR